jgi:NADH-quinone oxidoreductase subunit M
MTWREGLVLAPLIGVIVFMGIYPKPVLERMEPSVDRLIEHVEDNSDHRQPAVASRGSSGGSGGSGVSGAEGSDEARDEHADEEAGE